MATPCRMLRHGRTMVRRRGPLHSIASQWALTSFSKSQSFSHNITPFQLRSVSNNHKGQQTGEGLRVLQEFLSRLTESDATMRLPLLSKDNTHVRKCSLHDLATSLCSQYTSLEPIRFPLDSDHDRVVILKYLAMECGPSMDAVDLALAQYQRHRAEGSFLPTQLTSRLKQVCTPSYERLIQCLLEENTQVGIKFLIALREDLLQVIDSEQKSDGEDLAHYKQLDSYLRDLFSTWFSPSMLEIRRITYEATSAAIMEKIATKEAVHPLKSLDDLRSRLGPDRRVFAAFHPLVPEEPLVFCHVALRSFIPRSMSQVMDVAKLKDIRVATFYSISSTQAGLSGVDLGQFLIKKAVKLLQAEFSTLESFVTLSPMPRFRKWLQEKIVHNQKGGTFADESFWTEEDISILMNCLGCTKEEVPRMFLQLLEDPPQLMKRHASELEGILMKWAARYLMTEKHRGKPLDGVARFHVRNGAEMYQLNYLADPSRKGWHNSLGMMINYRYDLSASEDNQIRYETDHHIPVREGVSQWLASPFDDKTL